MADDVQLPDLEVIRRYSLAVRSETAPRKELIAALEADLAWLAGSATRQRPAQARRVAPPAADVAPARRARPRGDAAAARTVGTAPVRRRRKA